MVSRKNYIVVYRRDEPKENAIRYIDVRKIKPVAEFVDEYYLGDGRVLKFDARDYHIILGDYVDTPLRQTLMEFGISQSDCARRFGIPLRTVQNWANGERECPAYTLNMMREILAAGK